MTTLLANLVSKTSPQHLTYPSTSLQTPLLHPPQWSSHAGAREPYPIFTSPSSFESWMIHLWWLIKAHVPSYLSPPVYMQNSHPRPTSSFDVVLVSSLAFHDCPSWSREAINVPPTRPQTRASSKTHRSKKLVGQIRLRYFTDDMSSPHDGCLSGWNGATESILILILVFSNVVIP